jgi:hypothetical protein
MNVFFQYLKDYFRNCPLNKWLLTSLWVTVLISLNYVFGVERFMKNISPWWLSFTCFYVFYFFVFALAYCIQFTGKEQTKIAEKRIFTALLLLAPFFFALKMVHWNVSFLMPDDLPYLWKKYWTIVLQWPLKLLLLLLILLLTGKTYGYNKSFWGLTTKQFSWKPYLQMLALMVPLIAIASTLPDFLHAYPKVKNIAFIIPQAHTAWPWKLLYEISYGLDFISIELFFRGFLVLGFVRFAGRDAILPAAAFYCSIHFGKPLGECISSYFGGLALGIIAYHTRAITGGLFVHLGIAYMMELGGYLGNLYSTAG